MPPDIMRVNPILTRCSAVAAILAVVFLTVAPAQERPVTGLGQIPEHLLAFGLVGITVALATNLQFRYLLAGAISFALLLELAQIPLPTRHARIEDFIIDALGACGGVLIVSALRRCGVRTRD
jgi:hypothetical protein